MPRFDVVVADTGALISLEKLGRFDLLREVCSTLLVPRAVLEELSHPDPESDYLKSSGIARVVECQVVHQAEFQGLEHLHYGERYAVALARDKQCALFVEDQRARKWAGEEGIRFFGAAGAIKINVEAGAIDSNEGVGLLQDLYTKRRINEGVLEEMINAISPKTL